MRNIDRSVVAFCFSRSTQTLIDDQFPGIFSLSIQYIYHLVFKLEFNPLKLNINSLIILKLC